MANEDSTPVIAATTKPRVLIADTSRSVRAVINSHLRDRFEVREAEDGEAAWQAVLLDGNIRVLLTEIGLTKVNGLDLLSRVRSSKVKRIRELPVVVMTTDEENFDRQRVAGLGVADFVTKTTPRVELVGRLDVLLKLSATREALAETQASLESARTVDPDTELLNPAFFDKQVDKLVSYARRNLTDLALICIRVELSVAQADTWEGEIEQRVKLVGRTLAASIRLEDLGTRSDRFEFCVATQSSGLSGVLTFAARLRKVLENVEAAGPGVEVWTCIGVSTLSEELRRGAEELRALAQKRALQAQTARSRRIVLGTTAEGAAPGALEGRGEDGSMDLNLALALIRAGRGGEVVAHLPRLLDQLNPLLRLVRQQQELQAAAKSEGDGPGDGKLPRIPR